MAVKKTTGLVLMYKHEPKGSSSDDDPKLVRCHNCTTKYNTLLRIAKENEPKQDVTSKKREASSLESVVKTPRCSPKRFGSHPSNHIVTVVRGSESRTLEELETALSAKTQELEEVSIELGETTQRLEDLTSQVAALTIELNARQEAGSSVSALWGFVSGMAGDVVKAAIQAVTLPRAAVHIL